MIALSPRLNLSGRTNILSIYLTAGFPELGATLPLCAAVEKAGAGMIEIGFPFSDPMADGPVIQQSSERAIANGMSLTILFDQLRQVRRQISIPLILMGYLNPALQFGFERFCSECAAIGIDGLILPDLPMEEYLGKYRTIVHSHGLHQIFMIDENTPDERIALYDSHTTAFLYAVSSPATTGGALAMDESRKKYFQRLKSLNLEHPFLIGFGISDRTHFRSACEYAAGAIVGTAFIRALETGKEPLRAAEDFVRGFLC